MFAKWLYLAGTVLCFAPDAQAGFISGHPVQTLIRTESQTLLVDQTTTPVVSRLNARCARSCALRITLNAAVDVGEPDTTIYAIAAVNEDSRGILPFDLVPLVQNVPLSGFRAPLYWSWVTTMREGQGAYDVDVALFTNGKTVHVNSRSVTVEVLEQNPKETP
ncbi:hypothetical protein [Anthocerotibacter panamensis]|uniref:hypothetical protein n=1 Tax=Anthocerotibacter panamensis TaxID=2857077 RepID=UPI001C407505|nr:hypothetical protein [Anthocerotibacter panamensis]